MREETKKKQMRKTEEEREKERLGVRRHSTDIGGYNLSIFQVEKLRPLSR